MNFDDADLTYHIIIARPQGQESDMAASTMCVRPDSLLPINFVAFRRYLSFL